ncbi:MAG: DsrE family protein [Sphingobium sp.]|nr:DsrE family protein [Sphingobium sp.]
MSRPPLALLLVSADPARLRAALTLGRAEIALGGAASIFLQGEAAALLKSPIADPRDTAWAAAGEPTLAALFDEALDDGIAVSLCQSGLAMAGIEASVLDPRIVLTGPIAFLSNVGDEMRLLTL